MAAIVGIDLGTTNSVVAARNAYGRPEVLANRDGRNITPSVVYFGSDPPAVGDEAKEWARLGNDEIASFFKPHMGSPTYRLHFHGRDYDAIAGAHLGGQAWLGRYIGSGSKEARFRVRLFVTPKRRHLAPLKRCPSAAPSFVAT